MVLRDSHDIGESLQQKLESLPDVERAFVHADYETSHKPEVNIHHLFIVLKKTPKLKFFCNFFYPASKDKISVESEKDLNRSCIIKKNLNYKWVFNDMRSAIVRKIMFSRTLFFTPVTFVTSPSPLIIMKIDVVLHFLCYKLVYNQKTFFFFSFTSLFFFSFFYSTK